jgi:pilus assembly protein CpaC
MHCTRSLLLVLFALSPLASAEQPPVPQPAPSVPAASPARPRNVVQPAKQILLKVQVFEVSHTLLQKLGFGFKEFQHDDRPGAESGDPATSEAFTLKMVGTKGAAGWLKVLQREGLAKVLAEPTLVTVSGRPASYFVGGEVPTPGKPGDKDEKPRYRRYGTEINYVPILLDDDHLSLEIRVLISQLDPSLDREVDGQRFPGIRTLEIDTGLEMEFGKTTIIGGMRQCRSLPGGEKSKTSDNVEHEQIETVFFITPERVSASSPARAPRPVVTR